jgi:Tfp pilus assembly protein PilV
MNKTYCNVKKGISIVEVIVASVIISLAVITISSIYGNLISLSSRNTTKVQAAFLLDESVEAIKTMRGESWSNIASTTAGVSYYFLWSTDRWRATTTSSYVDNIFTRTFTVSAVNRDASTFNILTSTSTGTLDTGTKKVDINVSWVEQGATSTRSTSMYVFDLN